MDSQRVDRDGPRVGIVGLFDAARLSALLQPWILEDQLRRRVPGASVLAYAPNGAGTRLSLDGGLPAASLGGHDEERLARLASEIDVLVVGGAVDLGAAGAALTPYLVEGVGEKHEARVPTAWNAVEIARPLDTKTAQALRAPLARRAYVSVVSEEARHALEKVGITKGVEVVPDPLLAAADAFPKETLDRRLRYLRSQGWFPPEGRPIVVDASELGADEALLADLRALASAGKLELAVIETAPGDETADLLAAGLESPWRLPRGAGLPDLLAAVGGASLVVSRSAACGSVARSFGVPAQVPAAPHGKKTRLAALERALHEPAATVDDETRRRLARHFDRIAALVAAVPGRERAPAAPPHARLWREVAESRARQIVEQRLRLAEEITRLEADWSQKMEQSRAAEERSRAEKERAEEEVATALRALERFRADLDWSRMETHKQAEAAQTLRQELETAWQEGAKEAQRAAAEAAEAARAGAARLEAELRASQERAAGIEEELRDVHRRAADHARAHEEAAEKREHAYAEALAASREIEARSESLAAELAKAENERDGALVAVREIEQRESALSAELRDVDRARTRLARELAEARQESEALRANLETWRLAFLRAQADMAESARREAEERDRLSAEQEERHAQRAQAVASGFASERARLQSERDGLAAERDGLAAERDRLAAERDGLAAERDRLAAERDELGAARARLETDLEARLAEIDSLLSERDLLASRRNDLASEVQRREAEAAALHAEIARTYAERDRARAELAAMGAEFQRVTSLRVFRYTAPLRSLYKKLRGLTGLSAH